MGGFRLRVRPERAVRATLAAASVLILFSCASGLIQNYTLLPPVGLEPYPEVIVNGVRVGAKYLDSASLRDYLVRRGKENLVMRISEINTVPFWISVKNGTTGDIVFDPRGTYFTDSGSVIRTPLDYTDIYVRSSRGAARKGILKDLKDVVLSSLVTLPPGDTVEGVLIFDRPAAVQEQASLAFDGIYIAGESNKASLDFRAVARGE